MKSLLSGVFCVIILCLTALGVTVLGADKKAKPYKVGDKVLVEWVGESVTAEVMGYAATGWVQVKFKSNGIEVTPTLPPDRVKPAAKTAKGGKNKENEAIADDQADTTRTWTDKKGKFKLKAKFVELADDQVTLEKENGDTVTIAIDKLSDADQKLARQLADAADENPFEAKNDNPFKAGSNDANVDDDDDADDEPAADDADWSQVEQVVIEEPGPWSLAPDAAAALSAPLATKPVMLTARTKKKKAEAIGFFDKVDGLLFSREGGRAFVVSIDNPPGGSRVIRVQRVDLVQGKAYEPLIVPAAVKPVAVDPSGKRLLARTDFFVSGGNVPPTVSIWELGDDGIKHLRTWNAHDPTNFHTTPASQAQFIDADHVLTLAFPGRLAVWEVAQAKALYRMDLSNNGVPALSANGKYLAAPANNGLYVLEALTGKTLGKLAGDPGIVTALSFHPNGQQLAALSPQRLMVWDLGSGELYRDVYFPTAFHADHIDWLSDGYVLLGGEKLVDLERRIVLWQYQHEAGQGFERGYGEKEGLFSLALASQNRQERGLFHAKLPHAEALKTAAALNADELLAVMPSVNVSLNVAVPADPQGATQALTAQLKLLGMNVVNGSRLVLQASTEAGATRQIAYRSFGRARCVEQAQVTEQIARVKFVENGKVIWEGLSVSGAPHMLQMKEGQSLQDALAPYQQPNVQFFSQVKLPQYVARPNDNGAYGASSLTPQGIQSAAVRMPKPGGAQ